MVVAYRVSVPTAFLLRTLKLVKVQYFSPPNLLAGARPEITISVVSCIAPS
jgi:lipid A disaccharide synthetase